MKKDGLRAGRLARFVWNAIFVGYTLFFVGLSAFAISLLAVSQEVGTFRLLLILIVLILCSNFVAKAYQFTRS